MLGTPSPRARVRAAFRRVKSACPLVFDFDLPDLAADDVRQGF